MTSAVIEQLSREQYDENESRDAIDRAWRIGANTTVQLGITILKLDSADLLARFLVFVNEREGDDITRAFNRGANSGRKHVQDVIDEHARRGQERRERAECEAADKRPVESALGDFVEAADRAQRAQDFDALKSNVLNRPLEGEVSFEDTPPDDNAEGGPLDFQHSEEF